MTPETVHGVAFAAGILIGLSIWLAIIHRENQQIEKQRREIDEFDRQIARNYEAIKQAVARKQRRSHLVRKNHVLRHLSMKRELKS